MTVSPEQTGRVYWITGLSCAGKTTTARALFERLKRAKPNVVLLDGDDLRSVYGDGLGYHPNDRRTLALRNARLCRLLSLQGLDVICATISLFHECHAWCRAQIPEYHEILLDVPLAELRRRDQRGLYKTEGNVQEVMGLDLKAEFPLQPHLRISTDQFPSAAEINDRVWDYVQSTQPGVHIAS